MTRFGYVMTTCFTVLAVGGLSLLNIAPKLIWNASASTPIGLYSIHETDHLELSDLVAIDPPDTLANFMVDRGYIARGVPLLKHVAALPGQQVCRTGRDILIDGRFAATAFERDRRLRDLPVWQGCRIIVDGDIFLLNTAVPDSLDSRYFGQIPSRSVIGIAIPLYTDADGDGRLEWRRSPR